MGHLYYHMLEKDPINESHDEVDRFKKKLHRYLYNGIDLFLWLVCFVPPTADPSKAAEEVNLL